MTDRKLCIRCARGIDALAEICPFCNWKQTETPPPPEMVAPKAPAAQYTPPEEFNVRRLAAIAGGAVLTLVLAFLFGMVVNRDGAPKRAPESLEEQATEHNTDNLKPNRADTPLVPAGEGGIDNQPITSAPIAVAPGQVPDDYQRTDATAVSADEYAQMARRARAEQKKKEMAVLVDPRSLTGPAYAQGRAPVQRPSLTPPSSGSPGGADDSPRFERRPATRVARTRPVPTHQPLPRITGHGKARLTLMIGPDGEVKDVSIEQALQGGNTAALIGAIQRWRFKPATENGEPVSAPYSVEISFGRE